MSDFITPDKSIEAMHKAREKLAKSFQPGVNARKRREKKIRSAADGRKLAKTGRTDQLNVRVTPEVKDLVVKAAEAEGIFIGDLIERLILDALGGSA